MSKISFTKMHGCGNDYIYVNAMLHHIPDPQAAAHQARGEAMPDSPEGKHEGDHKGGNEKKTVFDKTDPGEELRTVL